MHQTVADPRFLYWCDRLGLLVWADAPASYPFSSSHSARTVREWIEIVERDASHPSVVAWVAFNESWGVPGPGRGEPQRTMRCGPSFHLLRALDPTRPVSATTDGSSSAGDMLGHPRLLALCPRHPRCATAATELVDRAIAAATSEDAASRSMCLPRMPVVLSEFGGVTYTMASDTWEGYGVVDDEATFLESSPPQFAAVHESAFAGFCYTQLTDTVQERNGLLTEAREPKAPVDLLRAIITDDRQTVHRMRQASVGAES